MNALTAIFWTSLFIVFYSYLGYAFILFFLIQCRKILFHTVPKLETSFQPSVALIIPAYNEEDFILTKIKNTLELNYPRQKLSVIFITDGSTDETAEIIRNYGGFELMHHPERKGKSAALNRAMQKITVPVVIFCDANALLNKDCINEIVKHYADPKVGGVSGEKKILQTSHNTTVSSGESLYWKYESYLKKMDSDFYSVVGAAGELLSLRTALYENIEEHTIIEDFVMSLRICLKGYVIRYEPRAYAMETSSISMKEEQKRKVRISAGAFQAILMLKPLFNVFKYPKLSFQFISHRVLRWVLCPFCLVLIFISNFLLVSVSENILFTYLFWAQVLFYLFAIVGWILAVSGVKNKFFYIPYYFLFMNVSVFNGLYRIMTKNQSVLWEKAGRQ